MPVEKGNSIDSNFLYVDFLLKSTMIGTDGDIVAEKYALYSGSIFLFFNTTKRNDLIHIVPSSTNALKISYQSQFIRDNNEPIKQFVPLNQSTYHSRK
jgi:hypothetical protein